MNSRAASREKARALHNRRDRLAERKAGGPCEPPAMRFISCYWPVPLARRLRLLHLFRHLRLHGFKVEARALLHWRVFEEGL